MSALSNRIKRIEKHTMQRDGVCSLADIVDYLHNAGHEPMPMDDVDILGSAESLSVMIRTYVIRALERKHQKRD